MSMLHRGILTILVLCVTLGAYAQKKRPDDMRVSVYQDLKARLERDVRKELLTNPKFAVDAKRIEFLSAPVVKGQKLTVRFIERKQWTRHTGRFNEIRGNRVIVGLRSFSLGVLHQDDRFRLEYVGKEAALKKKIAEMKAELETGKERFVKLKSEALLIESGYTAEFFEQTIQLANRFWYRNDLGDGTVQATLTHYVSGADHMSHFLEVELSCRSGIPLAAVLVVNNEEGKETPICAVGTITAAGNIKGVSWKRKRVLLSNKFLGEGRKALKHAAKSAKVYLLKRHVGTWQLIPSGPGRVRSSRERDLPCPECWGSKKTPPPPPVDVEEQAQQILKVAKANAEVLAKARVIIDRYKAPKKEARESKCGTCDGEGSVRSSARRVRKESVRIRFSIDPASLKKFDDEGEKAFAQTFKGIPSQDDVNKVKKELTADIIDERISELKKQAIDEVEDLLAGFLVDLKKRMHTALEDRYEWMTADQMKAARKVSSAGAGRVMLSCREDDGYLPTKVLGEKVRRYTDWKPIRSFRRLGGMDEGYDVTLVYCRVLEVGGDPIGAENAKQEAEDRDRHEPKRQPRRNTKRPPDMPPTEEFMEDVPRRGRPDAKPVAKKPADEVPKDILKRKYVIQYSASFSGTLGSVFEIQTGMRVQFNEAAIPGDVTFPISTKNRVLLFGNKFKVRDDWRGDLIGSSFITFEQMIGEYGRKDIKFEAKVNKKAK